MLPLPFLSDFILDLPPECLNVVSDPVSVTPVDSIKIKILYSIIFLAAEGLLDWTYLSTVKSQGVLQRKQFRCNNITELWNCSVQY